MQNSEHRFGSDSAAIVDRRPTLWKPGGKALPKRVFDMTFAAAALILLAPAFATVILLMRLRDPGPAFFAQERVGLGGRRFRCWKFRTMVPKAEAILDDHLSRDPAARAEWAATHKLKSDPRVTPMGQFMRKSSVDELPQFFNVLMGDMSVVGPRPVVPEELQKYGDAAGDYLSVKPGITGLWQVSGRSDTSYDERVTLDRDYVRTQSLAGDVAIMVRTVGVLVTRRGSY